MFERPRSLFERYECFFITLCYLTLFVDPYIFYRFQFFVFIYVYIYKIDFNYPYKQCK